MMRRNILFDGCYLITLEPLIDERGSFLRSYDQSIFRDFGITDRVDHSAEAFNPLAFTLRGLHFQSAIAPEPKLVRCMRGAIFDVIVDLRSTSPTYTQWRSIELKENDQRALFISPGFAHGYLTLEPSCLVSYQLFSPYQAKAQRGIRWDDPDLAITWPAMPQLIGERDQQLPQFSSLDEEDINFADLTSRRGEKYIASHARSECVF